MTDRILPPHGGYKNLVSFQKAEIVYDATVRFCADLMDKRDRTVDQMIQAARSGKQNIVEGSVASGTSKEMELKLTSVARASLEELLTDYRDFLRTRGFAEWPKDHPYVRRLRELNRQPDGNYETFRKAVENPDPAIRANAIIGLIKVTTFLADVRRYNAAAIDVCAALGVPVNDLYTAVASDSARYAHRGDGVHFTEPGSEALGRKVAEELRKVL